MMKEHIDTGLKYLCQTKRKDPFKYKGSGKHWKRHLKKHGSNIKTKILKECSSKEELIEHGIYYSNLFTEAIDNAKELRISGNKNTITDASTLRKYCQNNITLNPDGRRTPAIWRGKKTKDLGFNWRKK